MEGDEITDVTYPIRRIILAILPNDLYNSHLQPLVQTTYGILHTKDPLDSLVNSTMRQEYERIAFARGIALRSEESLHEL